MATVATYRLDSPKPCLPPPPIRVQRSSFNPSSPFGSSGGEPELLYDLPTPTAKSPPPPASPASPTARAARKRAVSPPTPRRRSVTPAQALKTDLEAFAEDCRAWYYNNDEAASRRMSETLATLPSSERAPYSRLQAAVRSGYHAHMAARRNAEFLARIHAVQPGCSLSPHTRADPTTPLAAKERYDRFSRFIANWCTPGMPGTKPFFEGLWAVMRLQAIPEELGGAGGRRIEWEVDDAVFKEAAGKDFMLEAIDVLKGVLAFEDSSASKRSDSWSRPGSAIGMYGEHSRSNSQPLPPSIAVPPKISSTIASTIQSKRTRAPSDPFIDGQTPGLSRSLASSASTLNQSNPSVHPRTPTTPTTEGPADGLLAAPTGADTDEAEEYMRVWTSPDLPDAEYLALLRLFPAFVSSRPLSRFPAKSNASRQADLEQGEDDIDIEGREVKHGTGRMWVSTRRRSGGFGGGLWTRIVAWVKRVFC